MVVLGHTHMPFDRLADTRRFVNPGSVGLPNGHAGAPQARGGADAQAGGRAQLDQED
jgi:predicted phosphodiesterase